MILDWATQHSYITCGLLLAALIYFGFSRLFAPPPCLAHLPAVSFRQYCLSIFRGEGFDIRADRLVAPLLAKHGSARLWLGHWFVVTSDPESVRKVMLNPDIYLKLKTSDDGPDALAGRFLGPNLAESDGEDWKRHRKVVSPAFRRGWSTELFGKCSLRMVEMLKVGVPVEMNSLLKGITLDSLGLSVFGVDFKALEKPPGLYPTLYNEILEAIATPVFGLFPRLERLPIPSRIKARNQVDRFRKLLRDLIEKRRDEIKTRGLEIDVTRADLVTLMVQASEAPEDTNERLLTDDEIINDAVLFFFAGHDTTANTLAFAMYYLSTHQEIQQEATNEVNRILGRSDDMKSVVPTFDQQSQMAYLTAIIYESIRMAPVAFMLGRVLAHQVTDLFDYPLDKGTSVLIHMGLCMRDPSVWKNPNEFDPTRFLHRTEEGWSFDKASVKYMVGFGLGPRMCMGLQFALIEQRVLLSMILQRYSFELPPDSPHADRPKMNSIGVPTPKQLELIFHAR